MTPDPDQQVAHRVVGDIMEILLSTQTTAEKNDLCYARVYTTLRTTREAEQESLQKVFGDLITAIQHCGYFVISSSMDGRDSVIYIEGPIPLTTWKIAQAALRTTARRSSPTDHDQPDSSTRT